MGLDASGQLVSHISIQEIRVRRDILRQLVIRKWIGMSALSVEFLLRQFSVTALSLMRFAVFFALLALV